ncbi:PWWP domain-containing protein 2A [Frankliniella fusca]|uniref:PWWP domain-containing protein 2A n=1 Tax=Frankliniella fusca TaxID=407009 RepID=A0AAE1HD35_9NEOP|nr:PWWP domain-containing protein 2A [Frankliniella fusca]
MADDQPLPEICSLKNSNISVRVEEALIDFLIVSYEYDSKLYQGVLLDASKRTLPCGIFAPAGYPEEGSTSHGLGTEEDKMHNVAQRHSYFQEKSSSHLSPSAKDALHPGSAYHMRRNMRGGQSKFKSSRMTVRLRPRQVLCSKCKSICNENSENVDLSKKRKGEESATPSNGPSEKQNCVPRQISPKSPRPPFSENPPENKAASIQSTARQRSPTNSTEDDTTLCPPLISKVVKDSDVSLSKTVNKLKLVGSYWTKQPTESEAGSGTSAKANNPSPNTNSCKDVLPADIAHDVSFNSINSHSLEIGESEKFTDDDVLKSDSPELDVVGMYDSSICVNELSDNQPDSSSKLNNSFASSETDESQDRMILRKKRNVGSMEDLWDETVFLEDNTRRTTPVIKISFGAQGEGTILKIPAKVRSYHDSESDIEHEEVQDHISVKEGRTKAAKKAHKRAKKEARRKAPEEDTELPSKPVSVDSPVYDTKHLYHRRHKRKVKHKKRHKGIRDQHEITGGMDEVGLNISPLMEEDPLRIDNLPHEALSVSNNCDDYDSMKGKCLERKLSINLKRLNTTPFSQCVDTSSSGGSDCSTSNFELSGVDHLPNFQRPPPDDEFMAVGTCLTNDGRTVEVGDIVWGKIHGFPWWPGKVSSITIRRKGDGTSCAPQAHVAWFGSSTSSLMPCDQLSPFLETFKVRFNKKKRGPYKEAIRQATLEARKDSHNSVQDIDMLT